MWSIIVGYKWVTFGNDCKKTKDRMKWGKKKKENQYKNHNSRISLSDIGKT